MSSSREILTLQFGNYANYIGTHWWNMQESEFCYDQKGGNATEINHDVLYREGVNPQRQVTYTPRLLLVDLEGSLKHVPVEGELYGNSIKRANAVAEKALKKLKEDLEENEPCVEVVEKPEASKNDFQRDLDNPEVNIAEREYNLAESVDSWVDYLYSRYHPRTVNVVTDYKHSPDKESFDTFSNGVGLWSKEQFEEDFCDKIRQYVEECDYMQGFQTIFDCNNGFGGLASKCLEHLNDEYSKANFVLPVFAPRQSLFESADEPMSDSIRVANSALAFHQLIEQASLFVPLSTSDRVWRQLGSSRSFPSVHYQADNLYQTSAVLASYLDTLSLRYRLKDAPMSNALAGFCGDLTNYSRKLAAAAMALPFPMKQDEDLIDCLDKFEGNLFTQLTPNCSIGSDYVIQSLSIRGIPEQRLKRPREHAERQMRMAAYRCNSVSEMFQLYLQCSYHASMAHVSSIASGMPTRVPFPSEIFSESLNTSGYSSPFAKRTPTEKITSVPVLASVQSSNELGDSLEALHREAKRVNIGRLHRFRAAGLEDNDYADALEALLTFKDNYEDNWEL